MDGARASLAKHEISVIRVAIGGQPQNVSSASFFTERVCYWRCSDPLPELALSCVVMRNYIGGDGCSTLG